MSASFWACAVTAMSAYASLGHATAGAATSAGPARTPSLYALARSAALAVTATVVLLTPTPSWLKVGAAMIIVQFADPAIGATVRDVPKTAGPAAVALTNLAVLLWFVH